MPLPNFIDSIEKNVIRHIKYRGTIRTGEITADNGNETYDVKIAMSDQSYPSVETLYPNDVFQVGEIVTLGFEYGSKEIPKILGHGKKVAQEPVEIEVDYSGIARVETLDAYSITATTAYLEGRISLGGAGNCKTRGFEYGTTTAYGSDTHTDGSYGDGSYNLQITGLIYLTTYHFRAYIIDENDDTIYGDDNTFKTTGTIDIGTAAIDRSSRFTDGATLIIKENPTDRAGKITSIEIWAETSMSGVKVATFYNTSGTNFSTRDTQVIGNVISGSKQTFEVSLDVAVGDYVGIYYAGGYIEQDNIGGLGYWLIWEDAIPCTDKTFGLTYDRTISLYGTGS